MKRIKLSILPLILITLSILTIACNTSDETTKKPEITGSISTSPPPSEAGLVLGDKAPDFTLQTINGEMVKLSDFKGKTVMINMWWASCEGCVEEVPYIQKVFAKISSSNPEWAILTINVWDTPTSLSRFIESKKLTFPVLVDPDKKLDQKYLKYGVPTTFFLDANGIVREVRHEIFNNPDEIEAIFMSLLKYNLQ